MDPKMWCTAADKRALNIAHLVLNPRPVRELPDHVTLDFGVFNDTAGNQVDEEHLAGPKTRLALDALGRNVDGTGLTRHDDKAVIPEICCVVMCVCVCVCV